MSLQKIQKLLNAPKGQTNKFGNYKYRSCEDILSAVKPYLDEFGYHLILTDEIKHIGDRFYIQATACLVSTESKEVIAETKAFAREPLTKKGMDESQITGTASSYARKYSLNGLFAIDDSKDADSNEHRMQLNNAKPDKPHAEIFNDCINEMARANDISSLKEISRRYFDFFKSWNESSYSDQVKSEYSKNKTRVEAE